MPVITRRRLNSSANSRDIIQAPGPFKRWIPACAEDWSQGVRHCADRFHPTNTFPVHDIVAKPALGIDLGEQPRWG
jgi:hypothetical protein